MLSFFFRNHRGILSCVVVSLMVLMVFYGMGNSKIPVSKVVEETTYEVGVEGHKRAVSKRRMDAMKHYLSYDFGYGLNKALDKQNYFADGFFLDILDSSFGRGLTEKYFSLVKEDFAERIQLHRKFRFYRHPSGKIELEEELKKRMPSFYGKYVKAVEKDRAVDVSLLHDFIDLGTAQRRLRPIDMLKISELDLTVKKLRRDPLAKKRNFALFQAKSNGDFFGESLMELISQGVIEAAAYARDHGYSTSYEEARGIIMRRSLGVVADRYPLVPDKDKLMELHKMHQAALGIEEKDMVRSAMDVITVQKMLKDIDTSIVLDKMTLSKLYHKEVENLLVTMVHDSNTLIVKSIEDALELQCYLECIGKVGRFIFPPDVLYEEEKIFSLAPALCTKKYELKVARRTKKQVGDSILLKDIWGFQTGDKGWDILSKRFDFSENLEVRERFAFLQNLGGELAMDVDKFSREKMVEMTPSLVENRLAAEPLVKVPFDFNKTMSLNGFSEEFDESAFESLLSTKKVGDEIAFYTQDNNQFFRVLVLKKPEGVDFASFQQAKKNGHLTGLVDVKLTKLNKGRAISESRRKDLLERLLKKEAGVKVAADIMEAQKDGKLYVSHMTERVSNYAGKKEMSSIGSQFSVNEISAVIKRVGKNKEIAHEEFFAMKKGEISSVHFLDAGMPYYIELIQKKIDEKALEKYEAFVHGQIARESKNKFYEEFVGKFKENNMLEMTRFEKRA